MAVYKVYDIEDTINKRSKLTDEQIENIKELINNKTSTLESVSVLYKLKTKDTGFLYDFNENYFEENIDDEKLEKDLDVIAKRLADAEKITDNKGNLRRNKNITEGILFIEYTDQKITLLKLESTDVVDRETFKARQELSTDKEYYKIAIIEKDNLNNILIVDRNKRIAKYWAEKFLELTRKRDGYKNTEDLMNMLSTDQFLNKDIWADEASYNAAKRKVKEVLYESYNFNKSDLFQSLVGIQNIQFNTQEVTQKELYSDDVNQLLDSEFVLDKDVVYRFKREKLRPSDEITIDVKNFERQGKFNKIIFDENEMTLTIEISKNKVKEIRKKFEDI